MIAKKSKEKVNNRGAPIKDKDKRVNEYHVFVWQWKRIVDEANVRDISPFAFLRQIIDWFFTALDTGRADVTASKLFDDKFKEGLSVDNNK